VASIKIMDLSDVALKRRYLWNEKRTQLMLRICDICDICRFLGFVKKFKKIHTA